MSLKVTYLDEGRGVEIVAEGVVYGEQIVEANQRIYDQARLKIQRYQIIDKSACTEYSVTADDIEAIAELDKKASLINPRIIIAVIESHRLQFSLTELWQAHLRDCPFLTRSFRNRQSATAWILENAGRQ